MEGINLATMAHMATVDLAMAHLAMALKAVITKVGYSIETAIIIVCVVV